MPSQAVTEMLGRFDRATKTGDQWLVRCPAHEDRKASLAVSEGSDGKVILFCHAGCQVVAILASLGLGVSALFTEPSKSRREVAAYDYRDVSGALRYQVVRFDPKDFRQRRPDGSGGWIWNLQGVERVLYRLPELAGQSAVVVVEGEKDADALWSHGIAATTNVSGAGKWRDGYSQQLRDAGVRSVVILPDADDPGRAHATQVLASVEGVGISGRIVPLAVSAKGDVSDYLATHSAADLTALFTDTAPAPAWLDVDRQLEAMATEDLEAMSGQRVFLGLPALDEALSGIRRGEVCGLMGRPGIGKTLFLTHIAQAVTEVAGHVFVSLEMPAAQIVARLQQRLYGLGRHQREDAARGGRLDAAHYRRTFEKLIVVETPGLSVPQIGDVLEQILAGPFKNIPLGLVTIDHLGLIGGDRKLATYDRVSLQAREIKELAKRLKCAVLVAIQVNRDAGGDGSRELGLGSARDSGVVEEAMDYLIGLRRLDRSLTLAPFERDKYRDVIFAKVIKNRHGEAGHSEIAYRFYPVGLRLEEDTRLHPQADDIERIAQTRAGGRR